MDRNRDHILEEIVSYHTQIRRLCYREVFRETNALTLAEDIAQEVMIKACRAAHEFEGSSTLFSWLYRITKNECMQYFRHRFREKLGSFREVYLSQTSPDWVENVTGLTDPEKVYLARIHMKAFIAKLDEANRQLLWLYFQGYKQEEIAKLMDLKLGTVKSKISRLLEDLRENRFFE